MKLINPRNKPEYNPAYKRRLLHTSQFIYKNDIVPPVLVIGEKSDFELLLNQYFPLIDFQYTNFDLNNKWTMQSALYKTVLCFQVIEHLLNPLLFMKEVNRVLTPLGRFYISYPTHGTKMFWSSGHFHEYDESRFYYLVKESGFETIDYMQRIMWRRIKGVRSIVRNTPIGWCKHHFYYLKKE